VTSDNQHFEHIIEEWIGSLPADRSELQSKDALLSLIEHAHNYGARRGRVYGARVVGKYFAPFLTGVTEEEGQLHFARLKAVMDALDSSAPLDLDAIEREYPVPARRESR